MNQKKLFLVDGASDNLLSNLDSRDIALWLIDLPKECPQLETLISFLGLPWRLFELAARLEREATGQDLIGTDLAIIAAGERDRGGTQGVIRELVSLRSYSRTCLTLQLLL